MTTIRADQTFRIIASSSPKYLPAANEVNLTRKKEKIKMIAVTQMPGLGGSQLPVVTFSRLPPPGGGSGGGGKRPAGKPAKKGPAKKAGGGKAKKGAKRR
jgi:hypothetical protein